MANNGVLLLSIARFCKNIKMASCFRHCEILLFCVESVQISSLRDLTKSSRGNPKH